MTRTSRILIPADVDNATLTVAGRARTEAFRIDNVPARVRGRGDLWKPLLLARGRTDLDKFLQGKGRGSKVRS